MKFSIMIAAIDERKEQLDVLKAFLSDQIRKNSLQSEVEIVVYLDNRVVPVGMKRNILISSVIGEYAAFVDDDDWVADDYVKTIYDALIEHPDVDCLGIKGLFTDGLNSKEFLHSIKYTKYSEDENYFYRPPNHLNPIKKEILIRHKFPLKNVGEDYNFSMSLINSGDLKTEFYINRILYYYRFDHKKTKTQSDSYISAIKRRFTKGG